MIRDVLDCPHRALLGSGGDQSPSHWCRLLADLSGVQGDQWCVVPTQVCQQCCRFHTPEIDKLNPVVASRLYQLSTEILGQGGIKGCNSQHAEMLRLRARADLPSDRSDADEASSEKRSILWNLASLRSLLPLRRKRKRIATWSVGITTATRRQPTLACCVQSVIHAGWHAPRLFVDGGVSLPESCRSLPVTVRDTAVGAWPNYYLGLAELIMRDPGADAYMLLQDDALLCHCSNLRSYLESILWVSDREGVASLYCSRAYTQSQRGWYRFRRPWRWGALAFVFSPSAAQRFLSSPYVCKHRWRTGSVGRAHIDGLLGMWAHRDRIPLYYPTPSLVQHVGVSSTLWSIAQASGDRHAEWFAVDCHDLP